MIDYGVIRNIDDLLVNPAYNMRRSTTSSHEQDMSPAAPSIFVLKRGGKDAGRDFAFRDLTRESPLWPSYDSDEELASPIDQDDDDDDMSLHTTSEEDENYAGESGRTFTLPRSSVVETAVIAEVHCSTAHTVQIRSPGKPRVVAVQSPTSPRFPRTFDGRQSQSTSEAASSEDERNGSISSGHSHKSSISTVASSADEMPPALQPRSIRRKPSTGFLASADDKVASSLAARRGTPPLAPIVPRSKPLMDVIKSPIFPVTQRSSSLRRRETSIVDSPATMISPRPESPSMPKRRMQKFSSTLNLGRFASRSRSSRGLNDDKAQSSSSSTTSSEVEVGKESEIMISPPSRSALRSKLVPRGANERAAPLRLPPCPENCLSRSDEVDEDHEEDMEDEDEVWPLRVDSVMSNRGSVGLKLSDKWIVPGDSHGLRRRSASIDIGMRRS